MQWGAVQAVPSGVIRPTANMQLPRSCCSPLPSTGQGPCPQLCRVGSACWPFSGAVAVVLKQGKREFLTPQKIPIKPGCQAMSQPETIKLLVCHNLSASSCAPMSVQVSRREQICLAKAGLSHCVTHIVLLTPVCSGSAISLHRTVTPLHLASIKSQ